MLRLESSPAGALHIRALSVRAATVNAEERSVEAVVMTERPVESQEMLDGALTGRAWREEVLLSGLEFGERVPLLHAHNQWSVHDVFGSVRALRREGDQLLGRLMFSSDDGCIIDRTWQKVREGHITDVSGGYTPLERVNVPPGERVDVAGRTFDGGREGRSLVTRAVLREVSILAVGADPETKIRAASAPLCRRCSQRLHARGETLASALNALIAEAAEDRTRAEVIQELAGAAEIAAGTVEEILSAGIDCPPRERLEGFAAVLDVPLEDLIRAAEEDGCRYE